MEDLSNSFGFMKAVTLVLRLQAAGLLFAGVPCNTFGFMSSGTHQRCEEMPYGNLHQAFVILGNVLASRCCLLLMLALSRSTCWAIENPARSKIVFFPYLDRLLTAPIFQHFSVFWWGFLQQP